MRRRQHADPDPISSAAPPAGGAAPGKRSRTEEMAGHRAPADQALADHPADQALPAMLFAPVVQRRAAASAPSPDGTPVPAAPAAGGGLPDPVRGKMEHAFGADFSSVEVVPDSASAAGLGADAYARGEQLHFAPGNYDPGSLRGHELIGHELAHVVQQREGRVAATAQAHGLPVNHDRSLEDQADRQGADAARGQVVGAGSARAGAGPAVIQGRFTYNRREASAAEIAVVRAHVARRAPARLDDFETKVGSDEPLSLATWVSSNLGTTVQAVLRAAAADQDQESGADTSDDDHRPDGGPDAGRPAPAPPPSPEPVRRDESDGEPNDRPPPGRMQVLSGLYPAPYDMRERSRSQTPDRDPPSPPPESSGRGRRGANTFTGANAEWIQGRLTAWQAAETQRRGSDQKKRAGEIEGSTLAARQFSELAWLLHMLNTGRTCVALVLRATDTHADIMLYANKSIGGMRADLMRVVALLALSGTELEAARQQLFEQVARGYSADQNRGKQVALSEAQLALVRARIEGSLALLHALSRMYHSIHATEHQTVRGRNPDKHAELRATDDVTDSGQRRPIGQVTLGISKLCCVKCAMALFTLEKLYAGLEAQPPFVFGGVHLRGYSSDQPLPDFMKSWEALQHLFTEGHDRDEAHRLWRINPGRFLDAVHRWQPASGHLDPELPRPDEVPAAQEYGEHSFEQGYAGPGAVHAGSEGVDSDGEPDALPGLELAERGRGEPPRGFALQPPERLDDEDDPAVQRVAQKSFEFHAAGLLPFMALVNATGRRDNCLITSLNGALGAGKPRARIDQIGEEVRALGAGVVEHGFLSSAAIPNILERLGRTATLVIIDATRQRGPNRFGAEIINPGGDRTVYLVTEHDIHFGWATLHPGCRVVIRNDAEVELVNDAAPRPAHPARGSRSSRDQESPPRPRDPLERKRTTADTLVRTKAPKRQMGADQAEAHPAQRDALREFQLDELGLDPAALDEQPDRGPPPDQLDDGALDAMWEEGDSDVVVSDDELPDAHRPGASDTD